MKHAFLITALAALVAPAFAASEDWITNYEEACKQAKEQNKLVFAEFTGSDWCGPCINMKKNVLDTPEFLKKAKESYILLELDYPRRTEQDAELKKVNESLQGKYGIKGFPTILILMPNGEPINGLVGGSSRATVEQLMDKSLEVLPIFKKAEELLASDASDKEKAAALAACYAALPSPALDMRRAALRDEILRLDPEDSAGLNAAVKKQQELDARREAATKELREYWPKLQEVQKDYDTIGELAANLVKDTLEAPICAEARQILATQNARVLVSAARLDEAEQYLEKAIALAPETDCAARLKDSLSELRATRPELQKMIDSGELSPDTKRRKPIQMPPVKKN